MSESKHQLISTGEATAIPPVGKSHAPITVIGTESIRASFDETCLQQAVNSRAAPGVTNLVLNPDAHLGYDASVGCRRYPVDEAPTAYKDFNEVLNSVKGAGLATEFARLRARFVIKDASDADD
jgi:RNA-splicing ligase RtcB